MTNETHLVDPSKVARQTKATGELMMMQCDSGNLLVTGQFILSLSDEQFFSVRCKLEVPELGQWYMQGKKALIKSERQPDTEAWERNYNKFLNAASSHQRLEYTQIVLRDCYLYTDGMTYTAIQAERIAMVKSENLQRADSMVIADGVHVLAPVSASVWDKNDWLKRLPGMVEVD